MIHNGNVKMAFSSLRIARGRSFLTMLGIIVGVAAVVITLSIGQGVRSQISDQLKHIGSNVIVIRPGSSNRTASYVSGAGVFAGLGATPLTQDDVTAVQHTTGVATAVPLGLGSGFATVNGNRLDGGSVIATNAELPDILHQSVAFGVFFNKEELDSHVVVIGQEVAGQLFEESAPIGRTLTIRGQDFIVRGVFDQFAGNTLALGVDLNKAIFIPSPVAASLSNSPVPVAEIFAQVAPGSSVATTQTAIRRNLTNAHNGQQDFSVLDREQDLRTSSSTVNLITQFVVGVAGLSLLVGGIGIVNIMLVSVSERTREIGIRKAVGATNRQIMSQFLVEAATLSAVGGLLGVLFALFGIFIIRVSTTLHPGISIPVLILVPLAAWVLGIFFGVAPAARAARKDPIDALRYE